MADIEDIIDPTDSNHPHPGDRTHIRGGRLIWREHVCWVLSRATLLGLIVFVMVKLNIPLRSLLEGNALEQMQSEKQRAVLDEVQLLRDLQRQLGEIAVALSTLRWLSERNPATQDEFVRTRDRFTNAANRFNERFAGRRNSLTDQKLERLLYDIRDTSRRISDNLTSTDGQVDFRKLNIQTDLIEKLISNLPSLIDIYICTRLEQTPSSHGKCL